MNHGHWTWQWNFEFYIILTKLSPILQTPQTQSYEDDMSRITTGQLHFDSSTFLPHDC